MASSLAELVLLAVAVWGLYRLLSPLQRRLESLILNLLLGEDRILDAETVEPKRKPR